MAGEEIHGQGTQPPPSNLWDAAGEAAAGGGTKVSGAVTNIVAKSVTGGQNVIDDLTQSALVLMSEFDRVMSDPVLSAPNDPLGTVLQTEYKKGNEWLLPGPLANFLIAYQQCMKSMMELEDVERRNKGKLIIAQITLGLEKAQTIRDSAKFEAWQKITEAIKSGVELCMEFGQLVHLGSSKSLAEKELKAEAQAAQNGKPPKNTQYGSKTQEIEAKKKDWEDNKAESATGDEELEHKQEMDKLYGDQDAMVNKRAEKFEAQNKILGDMGKNMVRIFSESFNASWALKKGDVDAFRAHLEMVNEIITRAYSSAQESGGKAKDTLDSLIQALLKYQDSLTQLLKPYNA